MSAKALKYTVIKSKAQYKLYTKMLEELDESQSPNSTTEDEIELLTLLIRAWDEEHNTFTDADPVVLIRSLMEEKGIKASDIAAASGLSKGLISDILNYKKSMSKNVIRFMANFFKLSQEALNKPYQLKNKHGMKKSRSSGRRSPARGKKVLPA